MNINNFWEAVVSKNSNNIRKFFNLNAIIKWHNTNEKFTLEEFIKVN